MYFLRAFQKGVTLDGVFDLGALQQVTAETEVKIGSLLTNMLEKFPLSNSVFRCDSIS